MSKWTRFMDMHSGGGSKEKWQYILIEAPIEKAKVIFFNRFGHNPERVTCTCCGDDYSISEADSLLEITGYDRNCRFGYLDKNGKEVPKDKAWKSGVGMINGAVKSTYFEEEDEEEIERAKKYGGDYWKSKRYIPIEEYEKKADVLIIRAKSIKPKERKGAVPKQGYVWVE